MNDAPKPDLADPQLKSLQPTPTERDWPEDFKFENGCYEGRCYCCKEKFYGLKRRTACKLCSIQV